MNKKPVGISNTYLEFEIDSTGTVKVEAHGFTDGKCKIASSEYEKALGMVTSRKDKPRVPEHKVRL